MVVYGSGLMRAFMQVIDPATPIKNLNLFHFSLLVVLVDLVRAVEARLRTGLVTIVQYF